MTAANNTTNTCSSQSLFCLLAMVSVFHTYKTPCVTEGCGWPGWGGRWAGWGAVVVGVDVVGDAGDICSWVL